MIDRTLLDSTEVVSEDHCHMAIVVWMWWPWRVSPQCHVSRHDFHAPWRSWNCYSPIKVEHGLKVLVISYYYYKHFLYYYKHFLNILTLEFILTYSSDIGCLVSFSLEGTRHFTVIFASFNRAESFYFWFLVLTELLGLIIWGTFLWRQRARSQSRIHWLNPRVKMINTHAFYCLNLHFTDLKINVIHTGLFKYIFLSKWVCRFWKSHHWNS